MARGESEEELVKKFKEVFNPILKKLVEKFNQELIIIGSYDGGHDSGFVQMSAELKQCITKDYTTEVSHEIVELFHTFFSYEVLKYYSWAFDGHANGVIFIDRKLKISIDGSVSYENSEDVELDYQL